MALAGKIALITGAASGLGRATAVRFAEQGAKVAVLDLTNATEMATTLLSNIGSNAIFIPTDVTCEDDVKNAMEQIKGEFGAPAEVIVNCAGIAPPAKVLGRKGPHPLALFNNVLQINVGGTFNVIRLAVEQLSKVDPGSDGERGVVINTASVAAFDGQIGQAAYAASKGAIAAMTLPLARDLSSLGIRVNTIAPGIMHTPMMAGLPQAAQDALGKLVPFPSRLGNPDEYAQLAQHLVENKYMNGETIRLDGSLRMPPK